MCPQPDRSSLVLTASPHKPVFLLEVLKLLRKHGDLLDSSTALQPSPGQPSSAWCSELYTILLPNHTQLNEAACQHVCSSAQVGGKFPQGGDRTVPHTPFLSPSIPSIAMHTAGGHAFAAQTHSQCQLNASQAPSVWMCAEHYWCRYFRCPSNTWPS